MKKLLLLSSAFLTFLFTGCSSGNGTSKADDGKIMLAFKPANDKNIKIHYEFSVNSITSNAITTFSMVLSGKGDTASNGTSILELKNDSIKMSGSIQGKQVSGVAGGSDSLMGDAKLIAIPVFSLIGKTYRSTYDSQLDKRSEVQISNGEIVDSTENKMQILMRYPDHKVSVGESWEKGIMVKAGNKMNCSAKYTLKEVKEDKAVISIEGKLFGNGESFGNEFSIDGKLTGSFTVDVKTGWPLNTDIHQEFTLKMGGKDIPIKYSIKGTVE